MKQRGWVFWLVFFEKAILLYINYPPIDIHIYI
jgi:hypothetical protein